MFQFRGFASYTYVFSIRYMGITPCEFSHSEIPGSKSASDSPRLIAGNHVLHRLPVPRHPPYALSNFTKNLHDTCVRLVRSSPYYLSASVQCLVHMHSLFTTMQLPYRGHHIKLT